MKIQRCAFAPSITLSIVRWLPRCCSDSPARVSSAYSVLRSEPWTHYVFALLSSEATQADCVAAWRTSAITITDGKDRSQDVKGVFILMPESNSGEPATEPRRIPT